MITNTTFFSSWNICSIVFLISITYLVLVYNYNTICWDYGHHLSPYWYDIVHFGPKPSWICSWAIPKRSHTNGDICPSLIIYPWSSPFLANVGLWSYTQHYQVYLFYKLMTARGHVISFTVFLESLAFGNGEK